MNWTEFKPTILFLSKFLTFYLVGNLTYGLFVTYFYPRPDPATRWATEQTAWCLSQLGWETKALDQINEPTTSLVYQSRAVVTVYEGCNGLNVMIIFMVFVFAFGPVLRAMTWFIPVGLLIIHVSNLLRIGLLFVVTLKLPDYLYFTHKYLFTAFIYGFVLLLWFYWVNKFTSKPAHAE